MSRHLNVERRRFLRGIGACVALPVFRSLLPAAESTGSMVSGGTPRRMAFIYHPNGVNVERWRVADEGEAFALSPTLTPLEELREHVQLLSGLEHANATAGGDGAGDHARAGTTFLTGARARKTGGADIRVGVSVDQQAALTVGHQTRFPSLELSCDRRARVAFAIRDILAHTNSICLGVTRTHPSRRKRIRVWFLSVCLARRRTRQVVSDWLPANQSLILWRTTPTG